MCSNNYLHDAFHVFLRVFRDDVPCDASFHDAEGVKTGLFKAYNTTIVLPLCDHASRDAPCDHASYDVCHHVCRHVSLRGGHRDDRHVHVHHKQRLQQQQKPRQGGRK